MNSVEDDDFSHWDSLADELGIAPPPADKKPPAEKKLAEPTKPIPQPQPAPAHSEVMKPTVKPEPEPEVEEFGQEPEEEHRSSPHEHDLAESADTVLDEEELIDSSPTELETAQEGEEKEEGKGRRRRRRRRKKKGNVDAPAAEVSNESEGIKPPAIAAAPAAKPKPPVRSVEAAVVETGVEFLDDAPEELEDDDDQKSEVTSAMDEELMEETAQPGPEWKVVSWTELVGSLYRPER